MIKLVFFNYNISVFLCLNFKQNPLFNRLLAHVHAQSCLTLCDLMDCSLPGSSVHGISQARILEWVAISSSRGSSQPRDRTQLSCGSIMSGRFLPLSHLGNPFNRLVVQSLSRVWLFATPWTAACQASLSTIFQSLLKLMSIESVIPSNHFILCCPLLLLPSIFPSTTVFSNELALCIRWPEYWSFGFSINPSSEYLGLISFRIDWYDLLAIQGTFKSLL